LKGPPNLRLGLRTNIDEVLGSIDGFVSDVFDVAAPRAVNDLLDRALVTGTRAVSAEYRIPRETIAKRAVIRLKRARSGDLNAELNVKGKGFPLADFNPRQTPQGVAVTIKGRRRVIRHTFLLKLPNGHVGVFARGQYAGHFAFGKGRHVKRPDGKWTELPINELFSFGPPDAYSNDNVVAAMQDRVDQDVGPVMRRQIQAAGRGF
jgi:hypothetical protein